MAMVKIYCLRLPSLYFAKNLYHIYVQVQGTIWTELDDSKLYKQVNNNIEANTFPVNIKKSMVTPQQLGETIRMPI